MHFTEDAVKKFPGLTAVITKVIGINVEESQDFTVRLPFNKIEELDKIGEYRRFMWKIGVDPEEKTPLPEKLVKQALDEGTIEKENTLVDTCNLVALKHGIPLCVMDSAKVSGKLVLRVSSKEEKMNNKKMRGKELVLSDSKRVLCVYPHEINEEVMTSTETSECLVMGCGVPGIQKKEVVNCVEEAYRKIVQNCGGHYKGLLVLES